MSQPNRRNNFYKQFEDLSNPNTGSHFDLSLQTSSPLSEQSPHTRGALAVHRRKLRRELFKSYVESQRELLEVEREQREWFGMLSRLHYERRVRDREFRETKRRENKRLYGDQSKEELQKLFGSSEDKYETYEYGQSIRIPDNETPKCIDAVAITEDVVAKFNNQRVSLNESSSVVLPPIQKSIGMNSLNTCKLIIRQNIPKQLIRT